MSEQERSFQRVELRANEDTIYIDFVGLLEGDAASRAHARANLRKPGLSIQLNGCALGRSVDLVGALSTNADDLSTVAVATADLPDGELDLTFTLGGDVEVVSIRKSGRVIEPLEFEDHWNLAPTRDGDEQVLLVLDPECGDEEGLR